MENDKPAERDIGARIRVKAEHANDAAVVFEREGFAPIYVERRPDGAVSFWFGKDIEGDRHRLATAIPRDWYAIQGIALGPHSTHSGR